MPAAKNTAPKTETTKGRVAPELTTVSKAVPMPEPSTSRRGSKSPYPFDELTEGGMSFGIKNKTAKNMGSIVSNQNRKAMTEKKDAAGNVVFKMNEITDGAGNKTQVPTTEPEMVPTKRFFAVDCDPKTDPDGASVRVFREF